MERELAAKKQNTYREVNDRIESLAETESTAVFICECVQEKCDERVPLTIEQYERVRASPTRFLVRDGHQLSEVNEVVESNERYLIVENRAAAGF
jgi:hypothetical protein